ncbi:MAG: hypothetical protein J7L55_01000 [Desulfurococcales archaeon]|nr:hypothetical protein [Desulfurococcales archaeon]
MPLIDRLASPVFTGWIVEYFGDWGVVNLLMHRVIAANAAGDGVAVVLVQDFGGFNPYLVRRFCMFFGTDFSKVVVSRAFKLEDALAALSAALREGFSRVVVADPYLHLPQDPRRYWEATPLTAGLRALAQGGAEVAVFNRVSRFGSYRPEGGNFHHHSTHVMIRFRKGRRGIRVDLVKHPLKPEETVYIDVKDIYLPRSRPTLTKWVGVA